MARKLEVFPEPASRRTRLDPFLDGSVWELVRGEDYEGQTRTFVQTARDHAKARGGRLRTRKLEGERDGVVIQFLPRDL